jgi:hypothetical protein
MYGKLRNRLEAKSICASTALTSYRRERKLDYTANSEQNLHLAVRIMQKVTVFHGGHRMEDSGGPNRTHFKLECITVSRFTVVVASHAQKPSRT